MVAIKVKVDGKVYKKFKSGILHEKISEKSWLTDVANCIMRKYIAKRQKSHKS